MPKEPRETERPTDHASYRRWLEQNHGVTIDSRLETRYQAVVAKAQSDFLNSELWSLITEALADLDSQYKLENENYPLFLNLKEAPVVKTKSFDSFFLKTFRRNVLENLDWPDPPPGGWLVPDAWFSQLNDLVRTTFVVKYLDGVRFLGEELAAICSDLGLERTLSFEARMEGHYAAHLCVRDKFSVPGEKWDTTPVEMSVEIQITTQLQEVIGRLLHNYYEARRQLPEQERPTWQWDYGSDEFVANYLGHILHYVEGMIMEVRTRQGPADRVNTWLD